MNKREKIRFVISVGVLSVSIVCFLLISLSILEFNKSEQETAFPFRIEKRIEAADNDGNYSYETNRLPFSSTVKDNQDLYE